MRKIYILTILLIAFSTICLNACKKDTDIFVPDPGQVTGADSTWYSSLTASMPVNDLQTSLLLAPDMNSINVNNVNADTVSTPSGLKCIFPPNSCVDSLGAVVTGAVYIESYLLKNKGQLISMGLPTVSNGNLLVSRGVFSIKLMKGNEELQLANGANLNIQYNDSVTNQQKMQLFNGVTTNSGLFNWNQIITDSSNYISSQDTGNFAIACNQLHWINCDYFYGDTSSLNKMTISVKLPSNLTNANTVAYLVFNDIRSIMWMNGDVATKSFISSKVPAGMNATIVTLSKDGNFYYLGQKNIMTTLPLTGASNQSISITPIRYSLNDIKLYLSSF